MIEKPNIKKVLEEIIPKGLNLIAKIGKGHKVTFIEYLEKTTDLS
jgi:hypothetical protein